MKHDETPQPHGRAKRIAKWTFLIVTGLLVIAAAVFFGLASRTPGDYRPLHLSDDEQKEQAVLFANHITDFGNQAGKGDEFTWVLTAQQANSYLASIDQIVSLAGGSPSRPTEDLIKAGYSDPVIAMHDGTLTFMVRSLKYDKVLSVDMAADFDGEGKLNVKVAGMRIGDVPVPGDVIKQHLEQGRKKILGKLTGADLSKGGRIGEVPVRELSGLLRVVVEMLGGKYVKPEIIWPVGAKHRVVVDRVVIEEGKLGLHVVPGGKSASRSAAATTAVPE